ncbi:hypothetical protein ACE1BM_22780, partial [Aeromonas jandaei]
MMLLANKPCFWNFHVCSPEMKKPDTVVGLKGGKQLSIMNGVSFGFVASNAKTRHDGRVWI